MVRLTRIYTKGGDAGETSLGDGSRVPKQDLRVAAFGTVDEANAAIGLARLHAEDPAGGKHAETALRILPSQVERLEREIDALNAELKPLDSFVLPGGTACAAYLHLARTVARRAERLVAELTAAEAVNPEALKFLNRLSDHLFVLSRHVNDKGAGDVLWRPGANR
jgi:cob(I)alamin adenosyltransferase